MSEYFRVTADYVRFYKNDPKFYGRATAIPDSSLYPFLMKNAVLAGIERTPEGYVKVYRESDNTTGYVSWTYLERIIYDPFQWDTPTYLIGQGLSIPQRNGVIQAMTEILTAIRNNQPVSPEVVGKRYIPEKKGEEYDGLLYPDQSVRVGTLRLLDNICYNATADDFAYIICSLKEQDLFSVLLLQIEADTIEQFPSVICRLIFMMPLQDIIGLIVDVGLSSGIETIGHGINNTLTKTYEKLFKKLVSKDTRDYFNTTPTDLSRLQEILSRAKELKNDPDKLQLTLEFFVDLFFKIKLGELDYWISNGDDTRVGVMFVDMLLLAEIILDILFGSDTSESQSLLKSIMSKYGLDRLVKGLTIKEVIEIFHKPAALTVPPNLMLIADGEYAKYSTDGGPSGARAITEMMEVGPPPYYLPIRLLFSMPPPPAEYTFVVVGKKPPQKPLPLGFGLSLPEPAKELGPVVTRSRTQTDMKELAKHMVLGIADRMTTFIYTDLCNVIGKSKGGAPIRKVNRLISWLRIYKYQGLNSKLVGMFTAKTTAKSLDDPKGPANDIGVMDLVSIWFWELGSRTGIGIQKDYKDPSKAAGYDSATDHHDIVFTDNNSITKLIKSHPLYYQAVLPFTLLRLSIDDWMSYSVFLRYDPPTFFKSIQSNDVLLNLMGSFTLYVIPDKNKQQVLFRLINDLSLQSATRFRKGSNAENKQVVNDHSRDENVGKKSISDDIAIELGGTIQCRWEWTVKL